MPGDRNNILCSHCIVLVLRLREITVGSYLRIVAFYVQCLTVAGVSQPSSNVTKEIRISQRLQNY